MIPNINSQNIAAYVSERGFYILDQDQRELLVCQCENKKKMGDLYSENEDAGIAFVDSNQARTVEPIPLSDREVVIEDGVDLFFAGYDPEKKEVRLYSGHAFAVNEQEGYPVAFSIDNDEFLNHPACPVFTRENSAGDLSLVGVISGPLKQVVHIYNLMVTERGAVTGARVQYGQYKGLETGQRGRGPRSILIKGEGLPNGEIEYKLEFFSNSHNKYFNPHHDQTGYSANKGKDKPKLYQTALEGLVNADFPEELIFDCYGNQYRATIE